MVKQRLVKIICSKQNVKDIENTEDIKMDEEMLVKIVCPKQKEKVFINDKEKRRYEKLKEYRSILNYDNTIKKLDTFAKWLFSSTSIVGVLAAGFSITNSSQIIGWGECPYIIFLIFIALTMIFVVLSLKPIGVCVGEDNITDYKSKIENELINYRRKKLKFAAICFSISIIAAVFTPLASNFNLPTFSINHEFIPGNFSKIAINGEYIKNNVNIKIDKYRDNNKTTFHSSSIRPNSKGSINKDIIVANNSNIFPFDSLLIECKWGENDTDTVKYLINSI